MRTIHSSIRTTVVALLATAAIAAFGCNQGSEGDRCNPNLSSGHNECGSGLTCMQPDLCPEAYCCPASGKSSNPYCQTGCNGGAASACNAGDVDACAETGTEAGPGPEAGPEASKPVDGGAG